MPGKLRHGRGKHLARSKKRKIRRSPPAIVAQQQAVAQAPKPAAPSASVPTPMTTPTPTRYPYIIAELRKIGILAGIMLAILVGLALVLS